MWSHLKNSRMHAYTYRKIWVVFIRTDTLSTNDNNDVNDDDAYKLTSNSNEHEHEKSRWLFLIIYVQFGFCDQHPNSIHAIHSIIKQRVLNCVLYAFDYQTRSLLNTIHLTHSFNFCLLLFSLYKWALLLLIIISMRRNKNWFRSNAQIPAKDVIVRLSNNKQNR